MVRSLPLPHIQSSVIGHDALAGEHIAHPYILDVSSD